MVHLGMTGFSTIHKPRTDIRRSWCSETARLLNHSQTPNSDIRRSLMLKLPYFGSHEDWDQRRGEISYLFDWFHTWVFPYCLEFEVFHLVLPEIKMTLLEHINNILKIHPNLVKFIWFYDNDLSNLEYLVGCFLNFIFLWLFVINTVIIWKYVISNTVELRK